MGGCVRGRVCGSVYSLFASLSLLGTSSASSTAPWYESFAFSASSEPDTKLYRSTSYHSSQHSYTPDTSFALPTRGTLSWVPLTLHSSISIRGQPRVALDPSNIRVTHILSYLYYFIPILTNSKRIYHWMPLYISVQNSYNLRTNLIDHLRSKNISDSTLFKLSFRHSIVNATAPRGPKYLGASV